LQKTGRIFEFEEYRMDASERRLFKAEVPIVLPPKIFDLLEVLVRNHGHLLEKEFLLKTLWPESFVEEANLAVNVSTLRKALGETQGNRRLIETVPKKGYRFVAEVRDVELSVTAEQIPAPATGGLLRWRVYFLAATALLVLTIAGVWTYVARSGRKSPGLRKIAVVPFVALQDNASQDYLGLGMADALITRLSRLQPLTVTPTSSVIRYSGKKVDGRSAGQDLVVDAVVEGHVQRYDNRIRVTVDLVRVSDGQTIWADSFDDAFTNVFSVEDSVSEKIAGALAVRLTGADRKLLEKRSTTNTEAYSLYMQGRYIAARRLTDTTVASIELFRQATEKDPNYAPAYAEMAFGYITRASWGWGGDLKEQAKSAALKALFLDESLPDAHLALGQVLMRGDWDWKGAEQAFDRAISLDRNFAEAYSARAILLTALSRHEESTKDMETACKLDPSSAVLRSDLAWVYRCQRRYKDALIHARKAVEMDPKSFTGHRELTKAYLMLGKYDQALAESRAMIDAAGGENLRVLAETAEVHALAGHRAEAEAVLGRLTKLKTAEPPPLYSVGEVRGNLGDKDAAFRLLGEAIDRKAILAIWINADPELDALRGDARYRELTRRAGL
jgi:TolB-like protein/DNA-binding winged helix-turn-helix (wHTH) protein/tetratricopeptide (TPR) repeat protein